MVIRFWPPVGADAILCFAGPLAQGCRRSRNPSGSDGHWPSIYWPCAVASGRVLGRVCKGKARWPARGVLCLGGACFSRFWERAKSTGKADIEHGMGMSVRLVCAGERAGKILFQLNVFKTDNAVISFHLCKNDLEMESYVQWERHPVQDCYHICSDGTRVSVLFELPQDKVFAMNLMALLARRYQVRVYCQVVMDTHFHLVAQGRGEDIGSFEVQMKRQLTMYFHSTGRDYLLKDGIWIHHEPIQDDVELMQKIIYVFRNPMDAGYPFLPEDYPWGAGRLFFHPAPEARGKRIGDLTIRAQRDLFRTRMPLPQDWLLDDNGMIHPRCYVDVDAVHALFGSPRRFIAFLFVRKKDLTELETRDARIFLEKRVDSDLRTEANVESHNQFARPITKLTQSERIQVARTLWQNRRTLSRKQLARAVRMNPAVIEAVFH